MKRTFGPKITGHWTIRIHDEFGNLKTERAGSNVVVDVGKEYLASFLYSAAVAASTFTMKYVAIGTDATSEAASNTALGTELARTTGTVSYLSNQIYQVTATFGAGTGTGAIAEYGLFSSSSNGTMFARDTEPVVNKGASDVLTVVSQFTIS